MSEREQPAQAELKPEELAAQAEEGAELPDREAMSLIGGNLAPLGGASPLDVLHGLEGGQMPAIPSPTGPTPTLPAAPTTTPTG